MAVQGGVCVCPPSKHQWTGRDLSNNSFSGTLPSAWSSLRALRLLAARNNSLYGTLPVQWGALGALQTL